MTKVAMAVPFGCTATGPNWPSGAPPTEMPGPKLAVVPFGNVVFAPVMATCTVAPCTPELGVSAKLGGPVAVNSNVLVLEYPEPLTLTAYTPDVSPVGTTKFSVRE